MALGAAWQLVIILSIALAVLEVAVEFSRRRRARRAAPAACPASFVLAASSRFDPGLVHGGGAGEQPRSSASPADSGVHKVRSTRSGEGSPPSQRTADPHHALRDTTGPAGPGCAGNAEPRPENPSNTPPVRTGRNLFLAASVSWKSDRAADPPAAAARQPEEELARAPESTCSPGVAAPVAEASAVTATPAATAATPADSAARAAAAPTDAGAFA